jgi:hypothetical protein
LSARAPGDVESGWEMQQDDCLYKVYGRRVGE